MLHYTSLRWASQSAFAGARGGNRRRLGTVSASGETGLAELLPFGLPNWLIEGIFPLALVLISLDLPVNIAVSMGTCLTAAIGIALALLLANRSGRSSNLSLAGLILAATILERPSLPRWGLGVPTPMADSSFTPNVEFYVFLERINPSRRICRLTGSLRPGVKSKYTCHPAPYGVESSWLSVELLNVWSNFSSHSSVGCREALQFSWLPYALCLLLTGGSAVTIVALGGLTYGVLREGGYRKISA